MANITSIKVRKTDTVYGIQDAAASLAIEQMKNGTDIDSFGDVETALATKVDKVAGKGLSTNDYDNTAKGIVDNIQSNVIANTQLIADTVGWSGKNIFGYTKSSTGIFTVNSDKTVTVNGEAPAGGNQNFDMLSDNEIPAGTYILNGCPDGGGVGTYGFSLKEDSASGTIIGNDTGSGLQFTLSTAKKVNIRLYVVGGQTIANKIFKPMLRKADILDATYEPYRGTTAFPRDEQAVLGAKNLLENTANTQTLNGVTFTVNADKSVTVNGTATASSFLNIPVKLPKGRYIFSGTNGQTGGSDSKYYMRIRNTDGTRPTTITPLTVESINGSETVFEVSNDGLDARVNLCVYPEAGTLNNIIFYPMIRLASDTDSTYAPYAMTNRELTEKKISIADLQTITAASSDFADFQTRIAAL